MRQETVKTAAPIAPGSLTVLLSHEGWHPWQDLIFGWPSTDPFAWINNEASAFSSGTRHWSTTFPASWLPCGKPSPHNDLDRQPNEPLVAYRGPDPETACSIVEHGAAAADAPLGRSNKARSCHPPYG